ncbi:MAG: hypothetical protein OEV62_09675 [Actinomycetota bacterium]|nr:hypothetical protein [Actinomycetota bacterium]MDH5279489.1 hypothetical protein [Actinomycetota bacterium]
MTEDRPDPAAPDEPGRDDPDSLDAAFDAIVAGLELDADPNNDSADEKVEPARPPAARGPGSFEELRAWVDIHPDLLADEDEEDDEPPGESDEHFVPPPPPPVPRGDAVTRWAWAAAVGAPAVFVLLAVLSFDLTGMVGVLLVGAFAAGFVTLVVRMKDGPRADDRPDGGAVV